LSQIRYAIQFYPGLFEWILAIELFRKLPLLFVSTLLFLLAITPVYASPSLSLGSTSSYNLTGKLVFSQSCTSDPVAVAYQACTGKIPPPTPPILGQPFLNDDFNYANMSQMQAAGWMLNNIPASYYSFGNGLVTFLNDGTQGGGATWTQVPPNFANWSVSARIEWMGNSVGDLQINLLTKGHFYVWEADGYYNEFGLGRYYPGQPCCHGAANVSGYVRQLNVFHTLRIDMSNNTIAGYFDGKFILSYFEPDTSPGATDLVNIGIQGSWNTDNSYDWITAAPATPAPPVPVPPPSPTTFQADLTGNVGWGVEGLGSGQANLLVSHNVALSVSPIPSVSFTPVTESGSFEQSINLSTRVESPGTAASLLKSALAMYLPALSASARGASGSVLQSMIAGQSAGPDYTQWWVNGPLSIGSPVQILRGWSSVTGNENLTLGSTLGTRPAWLVTSQLSQTVSVNIPNPSNPLGSSATSTASLGLKLLWSFDKNSDLLLRTSNTITLTLQSVAPVSIYLPCPSTYFCPSEPAIVTVTRNTTVTASLALLLSSTSLVLGGQATTLLGRLAGLPWMPLGLAGLAVTIIAGVVVMFRRKVRGSPLQGSSWVVTPPPTPPADS
jgi:hypothetical protein